MIHRTAAVLILSSALLAAPTGAQDLRGFYLRGEAGSSDIHQRGDWSGWFAGRLGRGFGERRLFSADVGLAFSGTDEGYVSATAGLEGLLLPRARLSPFIRLEAGMLVEPEFAGLVVGAGGGLALRLSDRLRLRAGVTWSTHGSGEGGGGPVHAGAGLEYRW